MLTHRPRFSFYAKCQEAVDKVHYNFCHTNQLPLGVICEFRSVSAENLLMRNRRNIHADARWFIPDWPVAASIVRRY